MIKLNEQQLLAFITQKLRASELLAADSSLFASGELDSMSMIQLLSHVEQVEGIRIEPEDVTLENFDSVNALLRFVQSRS